MRQIKVWQRKKCKKGEIKMDKESDYEHQKESASTTYLDVECRS